MTVLLLTNERCADHVASPNHPERPARLDAVARGIAATGLAEALTPVVAPAAPIEAIAAVHPRGLIDGIRQLSEAGGGRIDADTGVAPESYEAALIAAGAGLDAIERLAAGEADAAFCAVRPPGHHATVDRSMGFCLFNNVAVTATALADRGERVVIVDYDAHHGNGTQDIFYADPRVLFISFHEYPQYPGTGALDETGTGEGAGTTINFPLPHNSTGDVYRRGWHEVALPAIEAFAPTWLLLSAGFDAHRDDPLTAMGLTAGDYADLTTDIFATVPAGRRIAFLEGGYDLDALALSSSACLAAMLGESVHPEAPSSGGPGAEIIDAVAARIEHRPSP